MRCVSQDQAPVELPARPRRRFGRRAKLEGTARRKERDIRIAKLWRVYRWTVPEIAIVTGLSESQVRRRLKTLMVVAQELARGA